MYHTSPVKIEEITKSGTFGDILFFSDDVYCTGPAVYLYKLDSSKINCIKSSELYDEEIIEEVSRYFDVDLDVAENLLDGSESEWDHGADANGSFYLQQLRGECAKKMGYDGCEDRDEQGRVYIIPMFGREGELELVEDS